ncbi:MAG: hypothetical protein HKN35_07210 [Woeseia sp.]|nr:winged helix-turn-helix domain-containing protein [Woeseia sp.]MBT8097762.1 winged helix-turn-helix domain-containing protein [Woeseia sp.]NNE60664.1 hypothetical protein [Woeseia sp.]NNL54963.1 hypothetical protein [Woeseia sp.]
MANELGRQFMVGPWTVQPQLGEISGSAGPLHLEPKVMGVLSCLAERAPDVVTRDELVERVWGGRPVSDEVISRCISQLRTSLGDNPREPQFIQTIPKVGYRLIAPVTHATTESAKDSADTTSIEPDRATTSPSVNQRTVVFGLIAVVVVAFILINLFQNKLVDPFVGNTPSLAVLPFTTYSGDDDNEYFADGLTEELIDRLANVPELRVVASTSVFVFKEKRADARSIASELDVDYLLQGSVRKEGDDVRITAQLIDAERGFTLWSKKYETMLRDIFSVQDEISNSILLELSPQLTGRAIEPIAAERPTTVMPAYELLLRGRFQLKKRAEAPILRSIELFQSAIDLDSNYADAYRELARAYVLLPTYASVNPEEMYELAENALDRCLETDPSMAENVYDIRAFLHYSRWEWVEAEEDFQRAFATTPSDPNLFQWYSQQLAAVGKPQSSLQAVLMAKQLDLLSPVVNQRLAVAYLWVDDDELAARQFDMAMELGIGARANMEAYTLLLLRQRQFERARELLMELQKNFRRASGWIDPFIAAINDSAAAPAAREAILKAGAEGQISVKYLQGTLLLIGDADAAMQASFDLLSEPLNFEVEFLFAREAEILRRHERFGALVRHIGLDRYWDTYGWPDFCARQGDAIDCR